MELLVLFAMVAFVGMVAGTGKMMRPETAAQRRRREWHEAADEDRHMHRITQDVYKRMDKRHKRQRRASRSWKQNWQQYHIGRYTTCGTAATKGTSSQMQTTLLCGWQSGT
jgi:Flp pilus assembly protein TadB